MFWGHPHIPGSQYQIPIPFCVSTAAANTKGLFSVDAQMHTASLVMWWLLQAAELLAQATSGRRTLRERRPQLPCPSCKLDIAEFMATAQINL